MLLQGPWINVLHVNDILMFLMPALGLEDSDGETECDGFITANIAITILNLIAHHNFLCSHNS